jgi:hypothetical protein
VRPSVTIDVPGNKGVLLQSSRGVILPDVNIQWWATRIQNLNNSLQYTDPTHLSIYLTSDVVNFIGPDPTNCCVIGFHGAGHVPGTGLASVNGNGNQPVQTYAWASYLSPGIYARPNGGTYWALQDIHPLSHEVAEWADDPFINNTSSRGSRPPHRSTGAPTSWKLVIPWSVSDSQRARTRSGRVRIRMDRRAPMGTTILRTRYSSPGSCVWHRT